MGTVWLTVSVVERKQEQQERHGWSVLCAGMRSFVSVPCFLSESWRFVFTMLLSNRSWRIAEGWFLLHGVSVSCVLLCCVLHCSG